MLPGLLWICFYWYYVNQIGSIERGMGKRATAFLLAVFLYSGVGLWQKFWLGWLVVVVVFLLYDVFFDEEKLKNQWWRILLAGMFPMLFLSAAGKTVRDTDRWILFGMGSYLFVLFLLLAEKRKYLNWKNALCVGTMEGLLSAFAWYLLRLLSGTVNATTTIVNEQTVIILLTGTVLLEMLVFFLVEGTLFSYKKGFEHQTENFQREVLSQQYEEISQIYLNMRGWRHDYHNHLQVMKAQLTVGNTEEMKQYLDELEQDLNKVDTYIKSGNLMVDAILNGKLSIAETKNIRVNCKASLPETLSTDDVDLCVILGNLLDNAMEACEQIPEEERFLRIYMVVNKSQLYISIQNSAKEELDFNERNYITNKRGSHGFGMKRVKAMVDKYDGFLNLANEPGIFAAEVSMPL